MKTKKKIRFSLFILIAILFCIPIFLQNKVMAAQEIPDYDGQNDVVVINDNIPFDEIEDVQSLHFSELDDLGRCGPAEGVVSLRTLAQEKRGDIGKIKPSGWNQEKYPGIVDSEPPYLYNRSHLIAFMFFGNETNDERNLITGTRYFNANLMLTYELKVVNYVEETGNDVYYRVTPIFDESNLLAKGVLMEAKSEAGDFEFCVFCYNIQPGVEINYEDGSNHLAEESEENKTEETETTYIANKNSKVFHYPSCDSVSQMKEKNKKPLTCSREEAIAQGYKPCGSCQP